MKLACALVCVLYGVALLQMSFFVYFFPKGLVPNFIFLAVLILSVFEKRESYGSIVAALFGGFLMDVSSQGVIGFWPLLLFFVAVVTKSVLEEYVRLPIPKKF